MKKIKNYKDLNLKEIESVWVNNSCPYCGSKLEITEFKSNSYSYRIFFKEAYCPKCNIAFIE